MTLGDATGRRGVRAQLEGSREAARPPASQPDERPQLRLEHTALAERKRSDATTAPTTAAAATTTTTTTTTTVIGKYFAPRASSPLRQQLAGGGGRRPTVKVAQRCGLVPIVRRQQGGVVAVWEQLFARPCRTAGAGGRTRRDNESPVRACRNPTAGWTAAALAVVGAAAARWPDRRQLVASSDKTGPAARTDAHRRPPLCASFFSFIAVLSSRRRASRERRARAAAAHNSSSPSPPRLARSPIFPFSPRADLVLSRPLTGLVRCDRVCVCACRWLAERTRRPPAPPRFAAQQRLRIRASRRESPAGVVAASLAASAFQPNGTQTHSRCPATETIAASQCHPHHSPAALNIILIIVIIFSEPVFERNTD
jgi:hypothetical protein